MTAPAPKDRASALGYTLVVAGLAAIAAGLVWRQAAPREAFWTDADAREYREAAEAAHEASIGPGHTHGDGDAHEHDQAGPDQAELAAAKERFRAVRDRLEGARAARGYLGYGLSIAGALLAGAGVVVLRQAAEKRKAPRRSDTGH